MALVNESDYRQAEAATGDSRPRMGAGGYVCQVQAIRTFGEDFNHNPVNYVKDKKYVKVIYDVVEGEHAGRYSDEYFSGVDKDYAHSFYLSWKNLNYLKANCQAFDESNAGFDSFAALNAEQWTLFVGKQIGLVFGEEEYIANDGSLKTRLTLPRLKSVQDIRDGKYRIPALKTLDSSASTTPGQQAQAQTSVYDDDLPF